MAVSALSGWGGVAENSQKLGPRVLRRSWPCRLLSEAAVLVSSAKPMRIKEDILACTAAELNYGLAQFVKEITRPNGERYEPDSIYYLCLGIQQVREGLLPSSPPQPDLGMGSGEGNLYRLFCLLGTKRGSLNSSSVPHLRTAAHLLRSLSTSPAGRVAAIPQPRSLLAHP